MRLRPASQVQVSRSQTTRESQPIEKAMNAALGKIASNVKQQYLQPLGEAIIPEQLIANEPLNEVIRDTIKASVQGLYWLGAQYVNDAFKLNMIFTGRDADNVKDIAKDKQARFIYQVVKYVNREKQIKQMEGAGIPTGAIQHLDIEGVIERITNVASTQGINYGTIDKILQLKSKPRIEFTTSGAARVPTVDVKIRGRPTISESGVKQKELNLFPEAVVGTLVMWKTHEDDLVCPDCLQFEDEVFDSMDDDYPIPPDQTHPNCRCRLFLVDPNIEYADIVGSQVAGEEGIAVELLFG